MNKTCNKCLLNKLTTAFYRNSHTYDGLRSNCKSCHNETTKKSKWKYATKAEQWRKNNRKRIRENQKRWWKNNKVWRRDYHKKKYSSDENYRIAYDVRGIIGQAIRNNYKSGRYMKYLGCTVNELREYLSLKFKPGMTWKNRGTNTWNIDHIRPTSAFDLTNDRQLKQAFHYTNLQPLWANENRSKRDR